jgi:hypothetical protein
MGFSLKDGSIDKPAQISRGKFPDSHSNFLKIKKFIEKTP